MKKDIHIVTKDSKGNLIDENGKLFSIPEDWIFLPAGDAGITRKVTAQGIYCKLQFKKGRRLISKGVWAPAPIINHAKNSMDAIRSTEDYQKKKIYNQQRREKQQIEYEGEFRHEVEKFLNFDGKYKIIAKAIAILVTQHAIPVGSGTVARTSMIPIEERAAKAVIAWMRHQTTAYDQMQIPKIKGERRAVRRMLAEYSVNILMPYRKGENIPLQCPLKKALEKLNKVN